MQTMTAAVLYGAEDVRIEQRPIPAAGPGEVLVRIDRALTCGTDVKVFKRGYHARMIQPPALFGHEWAGVVEGAGEGADSKGVRVTDFKVGDRVVAANSAPCDECFFCNRGQQELCEDLQFLNGAYAQFIKVPARIVEKNLLHVPDSLSLRDAALVEPLACVVKGVEDTDIVAGETVVIIGAGPIGLMFIALCKQRGARVITVGRSPARLRVATAMGADEIIPSRDSNGAKAVDRVRQLVVNRGADKVIECVGQPLTWEQAIAMTRPGGTVNLFGGCSTGTKISIDTTRMHYDEITLKASFHHTPKHVRRALEYLANGEVRADLLITHEAPLARLASLLGGELQKNGNVKVAIDPWR